MGAPGAAGEDVSERQHLPDDAVAQLTVFELAARRHVVAGALAQAVGRQIGSPGIAEQYKAASARQSAQPSRNALRHRLLVAYIAGGDDLPAGIDDIDYPCGRHAYGNPV